MNRTNKQVTGKFGEDAAADFLKKNGYKILCRNYTSGKNEIDIIAENREYIVFCEVKARKMEYGKPSPYGRPASAVTPEKQRHLISAARGVAFRMRKKEKKYRFDVIEIYLSEEGKITHIHHIENAFST